MKNQGTNDISNRAQLCACGWLNDEPRGLRGVIKEEGEGMRRKSLLSVAALCVILLAHSGLLAENCPPEVSEVAAKNLGQMLQALPESQLRDFGFLNEGEIKEAKLGSPFRVCMIPPDRILNYTKGMSTNDIISELDAWIFPVVSGGQARCTLRVERIDGKWEAAALGGSLLAAELSKIENRFPRSGERELKFVKVFQAAADFVAISDKGEETKLVPLHSATSALQLDKSITAAPSTYTLDEIIPKLAPVVRANIAGSK